MIIQLCGVSEADQKGVWLTLAALKDGPESGSRNCNDGQGLGRFGAGGPFAKPDAVGDDVDRPTEQLRSFSAAGWRDLTITLPN